MRRLKWSSPRRPCPMSSRLAWPRSPLQRQKFSVPPGSRQGIHAQIAIVEIDLDLFLVHVPVEILADPVEAGNRHQFGLQAVAENACRGVAGDAGQGPSAQGVVDMDVA